MRKKPIWIDFSILSDIFLSSRKKVFVFKVFVGLQLEINILNKIIRAQLLKRNKLIINGYCVYHRPASRVFLVKT